MKAAHCAWHTCSAVSFHIQDAPTAVKIQTYAEPNLCSDCQLMIKPLLHWSESLTLHLTLLIFKQVIPHNQLPDRLCAVHHHQVTRLCAVVMQ
jgi:hypothetical protein